MEEEQTINTYELTLLFNPDLSEFDLNKAIDKIKTLITSHKGNILQEHAWGKRPLAYPILKHEFGHYHTIVTELLAESVDAINKELQLNPEVIRHLLLSLNKEGVTIDQLFTPEKEEVMISSSVTDKLVKEPKKTVEPKVAQETTEKKVVKPKAPKKDEATRQKELDKKIDDLLSSEEGGK